MARTIRLPLFSALMLSAQLPQADNGKEAAADSMSRCQQRRCWFQFPELTLPPAFTPFPDFTPFADFAALAEFAPLVGSPSRSH